MRSNATENQNDMVGQGRIRMGTTVEACVQGAAFRIDIEDCEKCGGRVKVIVEASNRSIEDPPVIADASVVRHPDRSKLKHLGLDGANGPRNRSPPTCADGLFDPATTTLI